MNCSTVNLGHRLQNIIDGNLTQQQILEQPAPQGTAVETRHLPDSVSRNEESDQYQWVLASLNGTWRVIACRKRIQWILQYRRGTRNGQPRWDGRSYHRTKAGLLDSVRAHCGPVDPAALSVLQLLPERFQEDIFSGR